MDNTFLEYFELMYGDYKEAEYHFPGLPGDIIDPRTGDIVIFGDFVKEEELPEESIISSDDFNDIFD